MSKKQIDWNLLKETPDLTSLKKLLMNDFDLMILYGLLGELQPIHPTQLVKKFNSITLKNRQQSFVVQKFIKIENFDVVRNKQVSECNSHSPIDLKIIEAHQKWILGSNEPKHFLKHHIETNYYGNMKYYYLTEVGNNEVTDFVREHVNRRIKELKGLK